LRSFFSCLCFLKRWTSELVLHFICHLQLILWHSNLIWELPFSVFTSMNKLFPQLTFRYWQKQLTNRFCSRLFWICFKVFKVSGGVVTFCEVFLLCKAFQGLFQKCSSKIQQANWVIAKQRLNSRVFFILFSCLNYYNAYKSWGKKRRVNGLIFSSVFICWCFSEWSVVLIWFEKERQKGQH
jgi:hypothetical protein